MDESKKDIILRKLYNHCATFGFDNIYNISKVSKVMSISRTLFYFYFKNTDDLVAHLVDFHHQEIDKAMRDVMDKDMTFVDYVHNLVDIKDLYFFTMRCQGRDQVDKRFTECLSYSLDTLDQYSYRQFVVHFELGHLPPQEIELMYASFRQLAWVKTSAYHEWSYEHVNQILDQVTTLVNLMKEGKF